MAKVTITIEDTPEGGVGVQSTFEPKWENPDFGGEETPAQSLGMGVLNALMHLPNASEPELS